jgi:hypothetical protein
MVAKKNFFGSELDRYVPLLHHYIARFPVICMGLLKWIRCNMCDRSYFEKGTHSLSMARFLSLVQAIAATQVRLRLHCVELLKNAFEAVETSQTEEGMAGEAARVKSDVLDAVVQLMMTDDGLVVNAVVRWMEELVSRASTDAAIVRHFVKTLLGKVSAPFSAAFVEFVAGLLAHAIPESANFAYVQQLLKVFVVTAGGPSLIDRFLQDAQSCSQLSSKGQVLLQSVRKRLAPMTRPAVVAVTQNAPTSKPSAPPATAVVKKATRERSLNFFFFLT